MATPLADRIADQVADAAGLYHRLLLIVGPPRTGKTTALRQLSEMRGWPLVNVNLRLSEKLSELTSKQRALRVPRILGEIAAQHPGDILIFDNTEILFSPDLQQDPLRVLQDLARNRTLIASWSGQLEGAHLTYAEPSHPEYKRYASPDGVLIQAPEGQPPADSGQPTAHPAGQEESA